MRFIARNASGMMAYDDPLCYGEVWNLMPLGLDSILITTRSLLDVTATAATAGYSLARCPYLF
eukprot:9499921-Pyramimonas_sp.AAC.1